MHSTESLPQQKPTTPGISSGQLTPPAGDHDSSPSHEDHGSRIELGEIVRILIVLAAALLVWFRVWEPFSRVSAIGLAATLIGGYPIFKEALENIWERRMTMELSMTIALLSALLIGEFFTALVITLFVLVAEVLEGLTVRRGRRAIGDLLAFLPRAATRLTDGAPETVPIELVAPGDIILVHPGERIPVDGTVVRGNSYVEQAAITGEAMPAAKHVSSPVFAGTFNQSGVLEVRAERLGRDTTFGKIIQAVERAEHSRAPIQKTADRLAGYLVYFAIGAALLTLVITHNLRSTISVIIVAGACGIAAGTPLAILGAIGRAARAGVIVKGGSFLEALAEIRTVLLDKTGTVTFGTPDVEELRPATGCNTAKLLELAAIAERGSEHPLGKAIVRFAAQKGITPQTADDFTYTPGRGIVAYHHGHPIAIGSRTLLQDLEVKGLPQTQPLDGRSQVLVAYDNDYIGSIVIADQLRESASEAVSALREMRLRTFLLTGDTKGSADAIAKKLGVSAHFSELLPEDKVRHVRDFVKKDKYVAMIGDGLNDAPALAEATVGVAMGSGTDVTRESADVVLIGNDLRKFVDVVEIARKCKRVIMQNFYGTLVVDVVGVGLAAFGFLNPLLAAFIHVSSELAFILNSTRLLAPRQESTSSHASAELPMPSTSSLPQSS